MANIRIAVINASKAVGDAQVHRALPAWQTQVHRDFAPAWGIDADLEIVPKGKRPKPGAWWLTILDDSDQAQALGYHDLSAEGQPLGKVFAGSDIKFGYEWTVTFSHELVEMLGDPDINLTAFVQSTDTAGRLYAYEVADACEADRFGYRIGSTLVSDFVYPAWFESFRKKGSTKFDHGGHITKPFQLLPGGYISIFDVGNGSGWVQQHGELPKNAYYMTRPKPGSRRERRRTPRDQWQRSVVKF